LPVEPRWLQLDDLSYINQEQIELFGGEVGVIDFGLVESAYYAPQNTFHYEDQDDLLVLAVQLGVGIARNHGFLDGNKRTGVVAMIAFLEANGFTLEMRNDKTLGRLFEACIARKLSEGDLVAMFHRRLVEME
jgi:death-on-curing protein